MSGNSFVDKNGQKWTINLTMHDVKSVRDCIGIDIMGEDLERAIADLYQPVNLIDALYIILNPDMTDEEFGRSFVGDTVEAAANAMTEALVLFFPSRRSRLMKMFQGKMKEVDLAAEKAMAELEASGETSSGLPGLSE